MGRPAVAQDDIGFPIFRIYAVHGLIHHELSLVINSRHRTRSAPLEKDPPTPWPAAKPRPRLETSRIS